MKPNKIDKLRLNKKTIANLDDVQKASVRGGAAFLSLFGSNCLTTNPYAHPCCVPTKTKPDTCGTTPSKDTSPCPVVINMSLNCWVN